jgi:uncharacterized protein
MAILRILKRIEMDRRMKITVFSQNMLQTVFITGATGGVGKAMAVECASRGWNLFLTDYAAGPLEILAANLRQAYDIEVMTKSCDLINPTARVKLLNELEHSGCQFSMIINVAGVDYEGFFLEQSSQQILKIVQTNIEATLELIHGILPLRKKGNAFRIINVSSLSAFFPMPVKATYAASKRFILDFSLALQVELSDQEVNVTILCPAGMPTNNECIQAIEAQGWIGTLTTVDVGRVANQTINASLSGKRIVIPGNINRVILSISKLIPVPILVQAIGQRWEKVRKKRSMDGTLPIKEVDPFVIQG